MLLALWVERPRQPAANDVAGVRVVARAMALSEVETHYAPKRLVNLDLRVDVVEVPRRAHLAPKLRSTKEGRSEEHTSELQSQSNLVCRLLLEKKKITKLTYSTLSPFFNQPTQLPH